MRRLDVSIELSGSEVSIGQITGNDARDAGFAYADAYLASDHAQPVSISLPLREEPFSPAETAAFFDGLLPEGFTRRSVAKWLRSGADDYLSLLAGLGSECLGAVRITEGADEPAEAAYRKIEPCRIKELAAEGAVESSQMVVESHLSLTGASGKVGLYYDGQNDEWYLPVGDAPSTHIIKQSHIRLDNIITNEQMVLMTASKLGIEVPHSFIIDLGSGRDGEILFASKRYDRDQMSDRLVDGLARPYRKHQEDLAQAMGIPAISKYEEPGDEHFSRIAELIRNHSSDPITDIRKLWETTVFNWLIGNTDNHIKNISLIYSTDLRTVRLAPAYDLISTAVYPSSTHNMAFNIGGKYSIDDIDRTAWSRAAKDIGMGTGYALDLIDQMTEKLPDALNTSAEELCDGGFIQAPDIRNRILSIADMRRMH
ncbi:MAG: type II toxin-antitoxin system HipA family toxin [Mogibacterium sp.]|nr:type II toxin-antitoxin system HipA family toxin [Mogibacterium sp.]